MVSKRDYYEVLGISRESAPDDIKKAFRQLALQYHPDRNPGDKSAEDQFKEINEAYSVLSDPAKRQQYDRFGPAGPAGQGFGGSGDFSGFGVEDIINDFFGGIFGGGGGGGRSRRGADLRYNLTVAFDEAVFGGEKEIVVPRTGVCHDCSGTGARKGTRPERCGACNGQGQVTMQQGFFAIRRTCGRCEGTGQVVKDPCGSCAGTGHVRENRTLKVKIPPGVDSGTRLKLRGEGEAGPASGAAGDLYVVLTVKDHPFFVREGADLFCEVPITFPQAALGATIEVPTLSGKKNLAIPAGTPSGHDFVMRGEGVAALNSGRRGNLVIRVLIEVPRKVTKRQKEILAEYQELSEESPGPISRSFFEKVKEIFGVTFRTGFLTVACLFAFLLPVYAGAAEAPRPLAGGADAIPVPRPGGRDSGRTAPIVPFLQAESEYAAGKTDEALSRFLDLAYSAPDDERKGFIWWRVGELLLVRGDLDKALEAADKAALLSRAPYLSLSAVDLKLRIYQRMKWNNEARQMAAYLLDRKFVGADPPALLVLMARVDAGAGKLGSALALYGRAVAVAADPQTSRQVAAEREAIIEGATDLSVLRGAAEGEEDPEVRAQLYLAMGNAAIRKGFLGMAAHAFERSARAGGKWSREAAERLFRAEKIIAVRPRIVGLVPLSGKLSDIGYAVLTGAEVALGGFNGFERNGATPVIRWVDTAGQPEKARTEFVAAAADRLVLGILGPVTGDEGRSVGAAFTQKSPPTLYLGQKPILEKPFLYGFGLSPAQEARALLSYMARMGVSDLLLFYPENGYGNGFAAAASAATREAGIRIAKTVSYSPETQDFTEAIKRAVGNATFQRQSRSKEKGNAMKLPLGGILIADRWDRVFLLASQLRYYNVYLPLAGFSGWNDPELLRKAVGSVSGAVFPVDYSEAIPGSQGDRFRKEFQEAMRVPPTRFEAMGYDGALFLSEAFALEGGSGRSLVEAMREKIPRLKNYPGVTGTFQFTPAGDLRRKVPLLQVELGNFVPVPNP